ncbi:hypothetical protein CROQUDRAFT_36999 [Cronartium quercuum f. sp. fusiforme G11]|uniref:Uncharacterized protein n=1 Tax=Cronartium quercuum f. sp. fusiforme G11 TaxID=708437 RepID=A0A9P6NT85_9BASI|nr:hypothetical protein CROQUDRAFT_36999 [Cronartium quercuum f. sp. fusiforme G11]
MCGESGKLWRQYKPLVLFADRISTKRTTGVSPYELVFGQRAVLPVDIEAGTFLGIDWENVKTRAELLQARAEQLLRKDELLEIAHDKMMKARSDGIKYWDKKMAHKLRKNPLKPGDMVLVYNKSLESQWGKLFTNRWNGPYLVKEQMPQGAYVLTELDEDRTELRRRYAASHVKRFYSRGVTTVEEDEESSDDSEDDQEDFLDDSDKWESEEF